jgi:hypothetical protein
VGAELLMGRLLAWVVKQVAATEGQPPDSLAVTHPANWGEYKLDLLRQAVRHVGLTVDHLVPEPVAAASYYASERDLAPGSTVAVYDLGGGTFDAAPSAGSIPATSASTPAAASRSTRCPATTGTPTPGSSSSRTARPPRPVRRRSPAPIRSRSAAAPTTMSPRRASLSPTST